MENKTSNYKTEIEKNGVIAFVPSGNSMWPMLKNRKQSVVVKKKEERLKKFDVALYQRPCGTFVLHRVMQVTEGGYVMCGDSQLMLESVKEDSVFGVLAGFYCGNNYVEATDQKYVRKVEKFYARKIRRKIKIRCFHLRQRIKNKFIQIFRKEK